MRAVLATKGSRGDVQPMLALGRALVRNGHAVTFCSSPDVESQALGVGLGFRGMGEDFQAFFADAGVRMTGLTSLVHELRGWFKREMDTQFSVLADACRDADVVVGAGLLFSGHTIAEHVGALYRYAAFAPAWLPTRDIPAPIFTSQNLPRWMNALSWQAQRAIFHVISRGDVNARRGALNLPPVRDLLFHVGGACCVLANDPELCPIPDDMLPRPEQTGAWVLQSPSTDLPADLESFLSGGSAPIYIGFGSMVDKEPAVTTETLLGALRKIGARGIISRGWAKLGEGCALPDSVRVVGNVPHDVLFRRVAAVVHHGGAGTTAAGSRSGVPQLVVPHLVDQFFWGHRVHRAGIAPLPLPKTGLRADVLAARLQTCLSDDTIKQSAARMGERLRSVDGVARMVELLEAAVNKRAVEGLP